MIKSLIEAICKFQGGKAAGQIVQQGRCCFFRQFAQQGKMHSVTNPCHFCNPVQWELFILNVASVGKTQGSQQIDGHVGSRHLFQLTPKSLLFQTFMQHKLCSIVGQHQLATWFDWKFIQNQLPQLPTKHGACYIQCQHAFSTDAQHLDLYKSFSHTAGFAIDAAMLWHWHDVSKFRMK